MWYGLLHQNYPVGSAESRVDDQCGGSRRSNLPVASVRQALSPQRPRTRVPQREPRKPSIPRRRPPSHPYDAVHKTRCPPVGSPPSAAAACSCNPITRLLSVGNQKSDHDDEDHDEADDELCRWPPPHRDEKQVQNFTVVGSQEDSALVEKVAANTKDIDIDLLSCYYEDDTPSFSDPTITATSVDGEEYTYNDTTILEDLEKAIDSVLQDHHAQQQQQGFSSQRRESSLLAARRDSCSTISTAPDTPETPLLISEYLLATNVTSDDGQVLIKTTTTAEPPAISPGFCGSERGPSAADCDRCSTSTVWPLEFLFVNSTHPASPRDFPGIRKSKKFVPDPMNVGDFYGDDDEEIRFIPQDFWQQEEEEIVFSGGDEGAVDGHLDGTTTTTSWRDEDDDDAWSHDNTSIRSDGSSISEMLGLGNSSRGNLTLDSGEHQTPPKKFLKEDIGSGKMLNQTLRERAMDRFHEPGPIPIFGKQWLCLRERAPIQSMLRRGSPLDENHKAGLSSPRIPRRCPSVGLEALLPPARPQQKKMLRLFTTRNRGPSGSLQVERLEI